MGRKREGKGTHSTSCGRLEHQIVIQDHPTFLTCGTVNAFTAVNKQQVDRNFIMALLNNTTITLWISEYLYKFLGFCKFLACHVIFVIFCLFFNSF